MSPAGLERGDGKLRAAREVLQSHFCGCPRVGWSVSHRHLLLQTVAPAELC